MMKRRNVFSLTLRAWSSTPKVSLLAFESIACTKMVLVCREMKKKRLFAAGSSEVGQRRSGRAIAP